MAYPHPSGTAGSCPRISKDLPQPFKTGRGPMPVDEVVVDGPEGHRVYALHGCGVSLRCAVLAASCCSVEEKRAEMPLAMQLAPSMSVFAPSPHRPKDLGALEDDLPVLQLPSGPATNGEVSGVAEDVMVKESGVSLNLPVSDIASCAPLDADERLRNAHNVHIDRKYDYYIPRKGKTVTRSVQESALHERRSLPASPPASPRDSPRGFVGDDTGNDTPTSSLGSWRAESPRGNSPLQSEEEPQSEPTHRRRSWHEGFRRLLRQQQRQNAYTNWGVLTARSMKSRRCSLAHVVGEAPVLQDHGGVASVQEGVTGRAMAVLREIRKLMEEVAPGPDCFDKDWYTGGGGLLKKLFTSEPTDNLLLLSRAAHRLIKSQPMVPDVLSPCRVFGDLHGQLRDFLLHLKAFGLPRKNGMNFIFNGDFVDRGAHQVELMGVLLAMKVAMPDRVWLIRGNHEDHAMNRRYGFRDEVLRLVGAGFGETMYKGFQNVFDVLPMAAVVDGCVLCVHGGIGDGKWHLNSLRSVKRPLKPEDLRANKMLTNILWSDPIEEDAGDQVFGVHASPRGAQAVEIVDFGWNVTKTFCAMNSISMVIRSHQCKLGGIGIDVMHDRLLMRVFSARDYEGHGNDGATLLLKPYGLGRDSASPSASRPRRQQEGVSVRVQVVGSLQQSANE